VSVSPRAIMSIEGDRQLSQFVPDRLPEFVRVDHPTLVAFMSAYYEWLGLRRDEGKIVYPMDLGDISDIDNTLDQFIERFKGEYLLGFPESLAVDPVSGNPVDPRRLIKNIRQFYLSKGTAKSYEFLFRILYDTSVEFYYPKKDILRLSSGKWTQNNHIRLSNSLGDRIYRAAGNTVVQKNALGSVVAATRCVEVSVYQVGNFDVAELLISGRNGTFQAGSLGIEFTDGEEQFREVKVYSVISSVSISNGGSDYQVGEKITFVPAGGDSGQRGTGTVTEIDSLGGIRKINIDDFGINYNSPPTISVATTKGVGFSGSVSVGALAQSAGFYSNNDGRLSTNKVLQDNHFYQNWSYVLKSEVVIDRYREVVRRLIHPVGTAMFGSVLVKRCSKDDLANASAVVAYKTPIIGHYAPYTFKTFDDLSAWFLTGLTEGGFTAAGYSPTEHDPLIQAAGNGFAVVGNPITNGIPFGATDGGLLGLTGFQNADPFWIVYEHPNKRVAGQVHVARFWAGQEGDASAWHEWSAAVSEDRRTEIASALAALGSAESGGVTGCCRGSYYTDPYDHAYTLLKYDENSEFRKITTRAFLTMKTGRGDFDCRREEIASPLTPSFQVIYPLSGSIAKNPVVPAEASPADYDFFKNIVVNFNILNGDNLTLSEFNAVKIRATLDNRKVVETNINSRKLSFSNIENGRHTLKLEMIDGDDRLVSGTREIVVFGYEFSPTSSAVVSKETL